MSRTPRTPSYRHHKPSGQAVVTLNGRDIYLGGWKSKASRTEYDRLTGEWLAGGRRSPLATSPGSAGLMMVELIDAYWTHVQSYYRKPDGSPTSEVETIRHALRPLKRLYATTAVADFSPLKLKALRQEMVSLNWCRGYVNKQIGRIRQLFRWGTENEMVPPQVYHGLQAVVALKAGRSDAREADPVRPVAEDRIDAVLPLVSSQVKAMIQLQLLTGMRPGEVCMMRTGDIDTAGRLWTYKPAEHKTQHHGHERTIYLGPRAKQIIEPLLKADLQAFIFSPAEAEEERHALESENRKTNVQPSQVQRSERSRRRWHKRPPGDRYDVAAYRRAIARACSRAFPVPAAMLAEAETLMSQLAELHEGDATRQTMAIRVAEAEQAVNQWRRDHAWHPHQLRHSAGTKLRREYGLEAAQVILGHKTLTVTQVYAEKNVEAAMRIMGQVG